MPRRALGAAAAAGARASSAAYRFAPSPVRRLVDSARSGTAQKVVSLQLEAFWQQHRNKVVVLGGVAVVYILWCEPDMPWDKVLLPPRAWAQNMYHVMQMADGFLCTPVGRAYSVSHRFL